MANPQTENGFTRLANEILEAMARIKLSPTQYRLLFVIWRYTYGFKRKSHNFSLTFFEQATGCDKRSIQRQLNDLDDKKIIIQEVKNGVGRIIEFNKNYEAWAGVGQTTIGNLANGEEQSIGETTNGETTNGNLTNGETAKGGVGETTKGTIGETANQERKKDKFKDNTTTKEPPQNCFVFYENNFGMMAPYLIEQVGSYLDDFDEQHEIIIYAMKIALERNKRSWGYIQAILKDWIDKGAKSLGDCEALQNEFNNQTKVNTGTHKKGNQIDWEEV